MKFKDEVIPIACVENFDVKTFETEYELSERSQMKLNELCEDLCSQNRPMCVIFASCFSHQSPIKQFLIEKGLYAAIDINMTEDFSPKALVVIERLLELLG